jgi:muramoyltetrapeptide carboxypeptidase
MQPAVWFPGDSRFLPYRCHSTEPHLKKNPGEFIVPGDRPQHVAFVRPKRLQPGDRVGIVAPSGPVDRKSFSYGINILKSMGLTPVFSKEIFRKNGYLAGSDQIRAEELHQNYRDPDIQAILCARGGYGSLRVLPHVDWSLLRSNPKILMGYSDVTALLAAVQLHCGQVVFHGPMISGLADISETSRRTIWRALASAEPLHYEFPDAVVLQPGTASGRLFAGNLTVLNHLLKTPYEPSFDGTILILEEINETLYRIDRMLTQMKQAECLKGVRGLMLGGFDQCGKDREIHTLFQEKFQDADIPVLAGCPFGHGRENWAVPMGEAAVLNADGRWLHIEASATAD